MTIDILVKEELIKRVNSDMLNHKDKILCYDNSDKEFNVIVEYLNNKYIFYIIEEYPINENLDMFIYYNTINEWSRNIEEIFDSYNFKIVKA